MAGSSTSQTNERIEIGISKSVSVNKTRVTLTGDSGTGAMPNTTLTLNGYIMKIVTNPGSTAPTDDYDIVINDEHGVDIVAGGLMNRDTSTSEQLYPVVGSTPAIPVFACGTHTMIVTNQSVNSAIVVVDIYTKDSL
jgi:hypothetical protein